MRSWLLLIGYLLVLFLVVALTGCETPKITSGAACDIFGPITYSRKDTKQTKDEIVAHNAVGAEVCGWPG